MGKYVICPYPPYPLSPLSPLSPQLATVNATHPDPAPVYVHSEELYTLYTTLAFKSFVWRMKWGLYLSIACVLPYTRAFISVRTPQNTFRSMARYLTTNILIVGKKNGADAFIRDGCAEYEKRLVSSLKVNTRFLKSDEELVIAVKDLRGWYLASSSPLMQPRTAHLTTKSFSFHERFNICPR